MLDSFAGGRSAPLTHCRSLAERCIGASPFIRASSGCRSIVQRPSVRCEQNASACGVAPELCFAHAKPRGSEDHVSQVRGRKAQRTLVATIVVGALGCTGVALAANQIKGAGYSGQLAAPRTSYVVSFKVSANGKRVTALKINSTPFYCQG